MDGGGVADARLAEYVLFMDPVCINGIMPCAIPFMPNAGMLRKQGSQGYMVHPDAPHADSIRAIHSWE